MSSKYHTVTPYLVVQDGASALAFYRRAFDAHEIYRVPTPEGGIGHAEIQLGDSRIMIGEESVSLGTRSPGMIGGSLETHPAIDFVAVTHSPAGPSQSWCTAVGGAGAVRIVTDPDRSHYASWGVGLSDREHFAGRESMAAVRRLFAQGIHNRVANGSRWQSAATFAIDAGGTVRWRQFPAHAGDLPNLDEAVTALSGRGRR